MFIVFYLLPNVLGNLFKRPIIAFQNRKNIYIKVVSHPLKQTELTQKWPYISTCWSSSCTFNALLVILTVKHSNEISCFISFMSCRKHSLQTHSWHCYTNHTHICDPPAYPCSVCAIASCMSCTKRQVHVKKHWHSHKDAIKKCHGKPNLTCRCRRE